MKTRKKILVAHRDGLMRRRLVMLLAASDFDVRSFAAPSAALVGTRDECFDLALVEGGYVGFGEQDLVAGLREIQPTLQVLLMVPKLDLSEVVQGIRQGATEIVALSDDPLPVLRQALALFRVDRAGGASVAVATEEITALERTLAAAAVPQGTGNVAGELEIRLLQLIRQNEDLGARVARLREEKRGLEVELSALVSQTTDVQRLQGDLVEVRQERALLAAAQQAIDEKARSLAELRANIASERSALECERMRISHTGAGSDAAQAWAELSDWRRRLEAEDDRLTSDAARVRQESLQLARERRRWQEDLDLIRVQEVNLRAYEGRLREMQATLEAERVRLSSGPAYAAQMQPGLNERALQEAWTKLQRTGELLEAERRNFLDDRLHLQEEAKLLRQREEKLSDRELCQTLREKAAQQILETQGKSKAARLTAPAMALKNLSRAPVDAVRLAFRSKKQA